MRVTIVLPNAVSSPVGGYKVHYEYARQLDARGHRVTVLHPYRAQWNRRRFWRRYLKRTAHRQLGHVRLVPWFDLPRKIRLLEVPFLHPMLLPPADITVLTGWQTSEAIPKRTPWSGDLLQIVYDYELFATAAPTERDRISRALSGPGITRVSTSQAVTDMLRGLGVVPIAVVPCGLDTAVWKVEVSPAERARVVGFPLRKRPDKGAEEALAAAALLHRRDEGLRFVTFGDRGDVECPDWVTHAGIVTDSELRALYNRCAVFVLPSRAEAWGLPAAEAMACGAAVVSTANRGVESFLADGKNARLVPVGDVDALAEAVWTLLEDVPSRLALAAAGVEAAAQMSWQDASDRLDRVLATHVSALRDRKADR
jgi:L-malate glycosyltransferase